MFLDTLAKSCKIQEESIDLFKEKSPRNESVALSYLRSVVQDILAWDCSCKPEALCLAVACIVKRDFPDYVVKVMTAACKDQGSQKYGRVENVVLVATPNGQRVYVDSDWRSRYFVARRTPDFDAFVSALPQVFIGTESVLKQHIFRNCREINSCLQALSMPIPPWRTPGVMLMWYASLESLATDVIELLRTHPVDTSALEALEVDQVQLVSAATGRRHGYIADGAVSGEFEKQPVPHCASPDAPSMLTKILKNGCAISAGGVARDSWPMYWGYGMAGIM